VGRECEKENEKDKDKAIRTPDWNMARLRID